MKVFRWSQEKNEQLKAERGVSFEDAVSGIEQGNLLDILEHPNREKYGHQKVFVVRIRDYLYFVPFVESTGEIFLKTIIPS